MYRLRTLAKGGSPEGVVTSQFDPGGIVEAEMEPGDVRGAVWPVRSSPTLPPAGQLAEVLSLVDRLFGLTSISKAAVGEAFKSPPDFDPLNGQSGQPRSPGPAAWADCHRAGAIVPRSSRAGATW